MVRRDTSAGAVAPEDERSPGLEHGDMSDIPRAPAIRGKTIRYIWQTGPTRGKTYEHVFHPDGTVEFREISPASRPKEGTRQEHAPERVPYAAMEAAPDVYAVSYLSTNGYTLTVVLDFRTKRMVGVASGDKTWVPVEGIFELVA
jgi:hypothetical protein